MLYEYILSTGKTGSCFSLYTSTPKKFLELSDTKTPKDNGLLMPTVVFVEESDLDVGDLLFPYYDTSKVWMLLIVTTSVCYLNLRAYPL